MDRRHRLAVQAQVLVSPRRYTLLRCISDTANGLTVGELADGFGLTRTAIRLQLAKLTGAGLIFAEVIPPSGPGRPGHRYRTTRAAAATWGSGGPFAQLSGLLAERETNGGGALRTGGRSRPRAGRPSP
jgi:predicted ArsR family transcriptional regulator